MRILPHRRFDAGLGRTLGAQAVLISPSRQELRRADPSLSFQVVAPGSRFFDVIVTTDPKLFDPANAHLRTPKNFRSSRQDFQGTPIEIETGFYLVPRAFLRDVISVEPRPSRLYYVAVAYADARAESGRYSTPPVQMAIAAPSVLLAADLNAQTLSKVLGMAVERLGAVHSSGRVLPAAMLSADRHLPAEIGGLPLVRRQPDSAPVATRPGGLPPNGASRKPWPEPIPQAQPVPRAAAPGGVTQPPAGMRSDSSFGPGQGFVDEDYLYAARAPARSKGFRDLDAGSPEHRSEGFQYDDGFGARSTFRSGAAARHLADDAASIPPLDPAPDPVTTGPAASRPPLHQSPPQPTATDPVSAPEALIERIIAEGAGGRYEAISLDGGYRGRFGPSNPYYQRAHDGLALGPHQAGQDQGELGALLSLMQAADATAFDRIFGADAASLLATTTATGPSALVGTEARSARVQPVAGHDLWESPWIERFRAAAAHPPFQGAMRTQIARRRMEPIAGVTGALGLTSERGLAMLTALAIHQGVDGARALARAAVNPIDTPARLAAALDALGHVEIGAFRRAAGLPEGDTVDDETHFALMAALRGLGADSPVQVPDAEAAMDALVITAGPGTVGDALMKLRLSQAFASAARE